MIILEHPLMSLIIALLVLIFFLVLFTEYFQETGRFRCFRQHVVRQGRLRPAVFTDHQRNCFKRTDPFTGNRDPLRSHGIIGDGDPFSGKGGTGFVFSPTETEAAAVVDHPFFMVSLNTLSCSDGLSSESNARACPMSISFFCNEICTCAGSLSRRR